MNLRTLTGTVVAAIVLFVFGFAYWAINPMPYAALNQVDDPAASQAALTNLFPTDGLYFIPGPASDPQALKLLETGPAAFVSIEHAPAQGADPAGLSLGFLHNWLTALGLSLLLIQFKDRKHRLQAGVTVGALAVLVINGSEVIWWMQPVSWVMHHAIYYVAYFTIATFVLNYFLPQSND